MENLGVLPGGDSSFGSGVSADGSVVAGSANEPYGRAFRWTRSGGMQSLGVVPGDTYSSGKLLSADGLAVVGMGGVSGGLPVRWTAEEGMHKLGLPWAFPWQLYGVSAHGTVIVGADHHSEPYKRAFVWSRPLGPVYLHDLLRSAGINLTGWVLETAYGVSYDGRAVVGYGTFNNDPDNYRAFLVTGLFKRSDYNHDGFVDGIDSDMFNNDFETADPAIQIRADVNFDWVVDAADYNQFTSDFEAGR